MINTIFYFPQSRSDYDSQANGQGIDNKTICFIPKEGSNTGDIIMGGRNYSGTIDTEELQRLISEYLPIASAETLGAIKIGNGLNIDPESGVASINTNTVQNIINDYITNSTSIVKSVGWNGQYTASTGTSIGNLLVNNQSVATIYAPTSTGGGFSGWSWSGPNTGEELGTLTINGISDTIYIPSSQGGDAQLVGLVAALNQNAYLPSNASYLHFNGIDYEWTNPQTNSGVTLSEPLLTINNSNLGYPSDGQILKYDGTSWKYSSIDVEDILIDNKLSAVSTNPVENKVITNALDNVYDKSYIDGLLSSLEFDINNHAADINNIKVDLANIYTKQQVNNIVSNTPETDVVIVERTTEDDTIVILDAFSNVNERSNKLFLIPNADNTAYDAYAWNGSRWVLMQHVTHGIDNYAKIGSDNAVKGNGIAEVYGVYEELAQPYMWSVTDNEGAIAIAVKDDGGVFFGAGIPQQTKEVLDDLKENKQDKESGKGLIDTEYAGTISSDESAEWLDVVINDYDQVYAGIKTDGSFYANKLVGPTIDRIDDAFVCSRKNLTKSSYVNYDDGDSLVLQTPQLTGEEVLLSTTSNTTLYDLIGDYTSSNTSTIIKLDRDSVLDGRIVIENQGSSKHLVIDGCGHKIYVIGSEFNSSGYERGMNVVSLENINVTPGTKFITEGGKNLEFYRTKIYNAESQVTLKSGSTYRIQLPKELYDAFSAGVYSGDNIYINISCWFVAYECLVTGITESDGIKYLEFEFDQSNKYSINGDYEFLKKYPTFYLINKGDGKYNADIFIKRSNQNTQQSKLYFPIEYNSIYKAGSNGIFKISKNSNVVFRNIIFECCDASVADIQVEGSTVLFDNCTFINKPGKYVIEETNYTDPVSSESLQASLYISNCRFENIKGGCINAAPSTICKVVGSVFKNCGLNRSNVACVCSRGTYHIENNTFEDYGYSAVQVGIVSVDGVNAKNSDYQNAKGVIQYNTARQTSSYDPRMTVMDSGSIYAATTNYMAIIRNNRIINYNGNGNNIGIFLDDGAYNVQVYSNFIENIPNSYAISARWTGPDQGRILPTGQEQNVNKIIAQNVVEGGIELEGSKTVTNNGCYLGTNVFLTGEVTRLNNLAGQEQQEVSISSELIDGILRSKLNLSAWRINN